MLARVLCVVVCAAALASAAKRYDGYKTIEAYPQNAFELNAVEFLIDYFEMKYEGHLKVGYPQTLLVSPDALSGVKRHLSATNTKFTVVLEDVQALVDKQRSKGLAKSPLDDYDFDTYNTLAAIHNQIISFYENCPSSLSCDYRVLDRTHQGEEIQLFKLGSAAGTDNAILMMALIHAREWITGGTMMKILQRMINEYGSDPEVTRMLDTYDFYIMPVYNPDGYNETWYGDRMQRKNMSPNEDSECLGSDLNRNNDYLWGLEGVSHFPCFETFCGDFGGSEIETQAYNNEIFRIQENGQTVWSMVDFHNYGRMWMHPWGYTENHEGRDCVRAEDHDDMFEVAEVTAQAIMDTHNTNWAYGTSCEVIYATTGATDDWAKGVPGVKYPFNPELRGRGFVTDDEDIQLSYEEVWNGLVAMTDRITSKHGLSGN